MYDRKVGQSREIAQPANGKTESRMKGENAVRSAVVCALRRSR